MTSNRLPAPQPFAKLSSSDQESILSWHCKQIYFEIEGLKDGSIFLTDGRSRAHHLKLVGARRQRLAKLAHANGHDDLMDNEAAAL